MSLFYFNLKKDIYNELNNHFNLKNGYDFNLLESSSKTIIPIKPYYIINGSKRALNLKHVDFVINISNISVDEIKTYIEEYIFLIEKICK